MRNVTIAERLSRSHASVASHCPGHGPDAGPNQFWRFSPKLDQQRGAHDPEQRADHRSTWKCQASSSGCLEKPRAAR